jgi:hypothetical protein
VLTTVLSVNFGRAPVRAVFDEALEYLSAHKEKLSAFVSDTLPISEASLGYTKFEEHRARKVVFVT